MNIQSQKNNVMNRISVFLIFLTLGLGAIAQSNPSSELDLELKVADLAKRVGDPAVVTSTFYRIIALEGENSTYKDSLAYIYFTARQFAPSFLMADEVLKRNPEHQEMLEIKAVALESLGAIDKSAEVYEKLFSISKNNFHGYSLAKLQFGLKKYDVAYKTIQEVEKLNDSGAYKVTFVINQNHSQQVELLAAIPYLKGLIEEELGKKSEAKASYEKSLTIQPDFVLPKDKIEAMDQ
jgi:tetratricopeptide (TPR) repeat protein